LKDEMILRRNLSWKLAEGVSIGSKKEQNMTSNPWITPYKNKIPSIDSSAFVDISARIIGDVRIGPESSIWPMAVLRGDSAGIILGRRASVLELSLLESPEGYPVVVEEESIISHNAVIHGAKVYSQSLVGIGAIVLEGSIVSSGCIIGAGSVVQPGKVIPPNSLVLGIPGKVVRETSDSERQKILRQVTELYHKSRNMKVP
jgi:carbonic anhydrase/acetyltransferase-like protein (isoleucine patch superfamily)